MKRIQLSQTAILPLMGTGACFGQTCTITSPTNGQVVQSNVFQFTATVSSAPSAYKIAWGIDNQIYATGYVKDPHLAMFHDELYT